MNFAIEKAHRGGNHYGRGYKLGVQGTGSGKFRPLPPLLKETNPGMAQALQCIALFKDRQIRDLVTSLTI